MNNIINKIRIIKMIFHFIYIFLVIILFSCNNQKECLPTLDLKKIYNSKVKIFYDTMEYYDKWGIIYLEKGDFIDEDNIKDIKIYKNHIYILTKSDKIYQYNTVTGNLEKEIMNDFNSPILSFDIDTLNLNIALLNNKNLNLYNKKGNLLKTVRIDKKDFYTSCLFYQNDKIILISNKIPSLIHSVVNIRDKTPSLIKSNKNNKTNKKEFNLELKSYCIGRDSGFVIYKNILNDTIFKFENNRFEPFIKSDINKHKIIYKGNNKFKQNARFQLLNIWHIKKYWFIQYNYWFKFNGKFINTTGLAIYDNQFNMLESDVDSYINGQCLYLDSTLDMFVDKENTTIYQVYKKNKSKWYICNKETPDSLCINYFRVK